MTLMKWALGRPVRHRTGNSLSSLVPAQQLDSGAAKGETRAARGEVRRAAKRFGGDDVGVDGERGRGRVRRVLRRRSPGGRVVRPTAVRSSAASMPCDCAGIGPVRHDGGPADDTKMLDSLVRRARKVLVPRTAGVVRGDGGGIGRGHAGRGGGDGERPGTGAGVLAGMRLSARVGGAADAEQREHPTPETRRREYGPDGGLARRGRVGVEVGGVGRAGGGGFERPIRLAVAERWMEGRRGGRDGADPRELHAAVQHPRGPVDSALRLARPGSRGGAIRCCG